MKFTHERDWIVVLPWKPSVGSDRVVVRARTRSEARGVAKRHFGITGRLPMDIVVKEADALELAGV